MGINQPTTLLSDLAAFAAVVDSGSFSAAARQLGLTPSAVSRQIARLERTLSTRLLERTTRQLRLSESGSEVYQYGREMVAAARGALEAAGKFSEAPRGKVRLSAPKAFARQVIHPLLPAFLRRYPEVDVQMVVTDQVLNPVAFDVDLAIRITDAPPPGLAGRPLMTVTHVLCATPAYLQAQGTPEHPRELAGHSCLYLGEHPDDRRWRFRRGKERVTVAVEGRYVANHSEIRLEGVMADLGIGCLPHFTAQNALAAGTIVQVLPDWVFMGAYTGTAWALYPPKRYIAPKLRVLIDHLVEGLREHQSL
ncbi:LysR family transcriptional regulator [Chitinolyticbacter meiyuanensis]|uniref:LysR family transcriptional regulator n=1 Tax=Chitinolyticbacter meiyuanensis TaxID=682798 RepID=UPI0011E5B7D1|nr:LysR family transcriptional regulator [Chitinolyticbacter meiyuanensis]